jgi:hypothetical protein
MKKLTIQFLKRKMAEYDRRKFSNKIKKNATKNKPTQKYFANTSWLMAERPSKTPTLVL